MALTDMCGFDLDDAKMRFFVADGNYVTTDTRFGAGASFGYVVNSGQSKPILTKDFAPQSRVIFGMALKISGGSTVSTLEFYGDGGVTQHCSVRHNPNGSIGLYRGATLLATSNPAVVTYGAWHYYEVTLTLSDTVGVFTVRVDEVVVATFSGDTKNAGTALTLDRWILRGNQTNMTILADDYYLCDDTGTVNNAFLGDRRVQTLQPSGAGANTGLTPVGSSSNWENVDETLLDLNDYNYSVTPGAKDTYAMTNTASGTAQVNGVQVVAVARKTDAGSRSLKSVLRSGGADHAGATKALSASPLALATVYNVDPATAAAWSVAGVDALEAGVEVV